jgi:hypothetical protein
VGPASSGLRASERGDRGMKAGWVCHILLALFDLRPWRTAASRPAWLAVPHHSVEICTVLNEREIMRPLRRLEDYFDLAIFVRQSTATTVLPKVTPRAAVPVVDSATPASL